MIFLYKHINYELILWSFNLIMFLFVTLYTYVICLYFYLSLYLYFDLFL